MKKIEEIYQLVEYELNNFEKLIMSDPRGLSNAHVANWKENLDFYRKNMDTLVQVEIVQKAHDFVDAIQKEYSTGTGSDLDTRYAAAKYWLGLTKESDIVKKFGKLDSYWAFVNRDKFVQTIYELYGYDDLLPTKEQIRIMEINLSNKNLSYEEWENIYNQIIYAKQKIGMMPESLIGCWHNLIDKLCQNNEKKMH